MLIAVPLSDRAFSEKVKKARSLGADIIELRVDQFEDTSIGHVGRCLESVKEEGLKTILTVRIPQEGGRPVANRTEILREFAPISDYTDVELIARQEVQAVKEFISKGKGKLIVSFHDFDKTPPLWVLREILREAKRLGADIPKISVMARERKEVARLLCLGNEEPGDKILISMGKVGSISRIAGFVFGSVISYASLEESFAPGQITLQELVKLRDFFYEKS
jgi:3-dehydroquinate dehydratase-1